MKSGTIKKNNLSFPLLFSIMVILFSVSSSANAAKKTLLVWGDSLSAAYGMPVEQGWVSLLQKECDSVEIVNGSISGETTQGGLTRLPDALEIHQPDIVILELGANDGLRGFPIKTMTDNLEKMIQLSQKAGARVILAGMKVPPNYGMKYSEAFDKSYIELAEKYQLTLIPFFLEGIMQDFNLVQPDGLHPTAEAQKIILKNVKEYL